MRTIIDLIGKGVAVELIAEDSLELAAIDALDVYDLDCVELIKYRNGHLLVCLNVED